MGKPVIRARENFKFVWRLLLKLPVAMLCLQMVQI